MFLLEKSNLAILNLQLTNIMPMFLNTVTASGHLSDKIIGLLFTCGDREDLV